MRLAFLFPGQGTRGVLEAMELAASTSTGRQLLAHAANEAGVAPGGLAAEEGRALERTEVFQPALVASCLAVHRLLADAGVFPTAVAGHSVGELGAWSAAGALDARDAVSAAALRGRLMAQAARAQPGGMVALARTDDPSVAAALAVGRPAGWLQVAARNAPDEVVLTGSEAALAAVAARVPVQRLAVTGAWHSEAMAPVEPELRAALQALPARAPRIPVVANREGVKVESVAEMVELLCGQLTRPVEWRSSLLALRAMGVQAFVIPGPGAVLRALVRRNPEVAKLPVHCAGDARELERTLAALKEST